MTIHQGGAEANRAGGEKKEKGVPAPLHVTALNEDSKMTSLQSVCPESLVGHLQVQSARLDVASFVRRLVFSMRDRTWNVAAAQGHRRSFLGAGSGDQHGLRVLWGPCQENGEGARDTEMLVLVV